MDCFVMSRLMSVFPFLAGIEGSVWRVGQGSLGVIVMMGMRGRLVRRILMSVSLILVMIGALNCVRTKSTNTSANAAPAGKVYYATPTSTNAGPIPA